MNNVAEMVADPQVQARESSSRSTIPSRAAPDDGHAAQALRDARPDPLARSEPGEHNEEVFVGLLGHSPNDLARWRAEGVI